MTTYRVQVITPQGHSIWLTVEARSMHEAEILASVHGHVIMTIPNHGFWR